MSAKKDPKQLRLRIAVEDLCEILERQEERHQRLCGVLSEKEQALTTVGLDDLESVRASEESLLKEVIEEEKERLLVTEEIGDLLEHDEPGAIRVSEISPHLEADQASELSTRRECLRETAQKLKRQNRINRALIEHSLDHVKVFLDQIVTEQLRDGSYDQAGNPSASPDGSFLMDRRG
ncbi:MAG: flagellar protein FlgN [Planctomycetota bacterium]